MAGAPRTPGVSLRHVPSVEALTRADLPGLDAVVLYYHRKTISTGALDALDRFASGGGGILAIHSATASFKEATRYTDLLGGRFAGHPPVGPMEIRAVTGAEEIFGPIAPFTITDEAYRHELGADIRVHFTARTTQPLRRAGGPDVPAAAPAASAPAPGRGAAHRLDASPTAWAASATSGRATARRACATPA